MRLDRRAAWPGVLAAFFLGVLVLQVRFEPPAPLNLRLSFSEDLAPRTVQIEFGSAPTAEIDGDAVRRVEVGPVLALTISTADGGRQAVSPALFFEVLGMGPIGISNAVLSDGVTELRAGAAWTSAQLRYRCCGDDSVVTVEVDAAFSLEQVTSLGTAKMEFSIAPPACEYDLPKVLCRFVRLNGGTSKVLVEGGHLLLVDLTGADVSGSQLLNVDLRGTSFVRADLRGSLVREANLMEADITGADVRGTIFRRIVSDAILGRP